MENDIRNFLEKLKSLERPKPFIQLVEKHHTRYYKNKKYVYRYYYLQFRMGRYVKSIYLGKKIPEYVFDLLKYQDEYRRMKKELKKLMKNL